MYINFHRYYYYFFFHFTKIKWNFLLTCMMVIKLFALKYIISINPLSALIFDFSLCYVKSNLVKLFISSRQALDVVTWLLNFGAVTQAALQLSLLWHYFPNKNRALQLRNATVKPSYLFSFVFAQLLFHTALLPNFAARPRNMWRHYSVASEIFITSIFSLRHLFATIFFAIKSFSRPFAISPLILSQKASETAKGHTSSNFTYWQRRK